MDQAFDARLQFHEGAVVGDIRDPAGKAGALRIFRFHTVPRVGFELLHAQADALGIGIEADDLHIDGLADGQRLRWMVDALPGNIGDVEQAVDAAQVDEGAVVGDVLHHALQHLAFLQVRDQLGPGFGAGLLQHRPARDDDIAALPVHLEDLEGLRRVHDRRHVAHRPDIDLAAGQEGDRAVEIDRKAALDPAEDVAGHALAVVERAFELNPGFLAPGLVARQHSLAVRVLQPFDIDFDLVAGLDFRHRARRGEFLDRHAAFGLQSDIDHGVIVFDRHNPAGYHLALELIVVFQGCIEQRGEVLTGRRRGFCRSRHGLSDILSSSGWHMAADSDGALPDAPAPCGLAGQAGSESSAEALPLPDVPNQPFPARRALCHDIQRRAERSFGVKRTGIENHRVFGGLQRGNGAAAVAVVAFRQLAQDSRVYNVRPLRPQLRKTAARPFVQTGRDENFHRRVRADDSSDIPAVQHGAAPAGRRRRSEAALKVQQRRPDRRERGNSRGGGGGFRRAQGRIRQAFGRQVPGRGGSGRFVRRIAARAQHRQPDGAIERARIQARQV